MKKLIQLCSILSLLVVFSVVSAQAQAANYYEANIPFEFNIGQKTYQSGSYIIKTVKVSSNYSALTLEDKEGNELQKFLVTESSADTKKQPELVFSNYDNQRYLAKILTSDTAISVPTSSYEKQVAKKSREKINNTQVALAKLN